MTGKRPVSLTPMELVRYYVQKMLDMDSGGWQLGQYVLCMSLERVTPEGQLESIPWVWSPPDQADWMTDGLMQACVNLRDASEAADDD